MIAHALLARPQEFRGRRGLWFIGNVASLMCLIRGRSDSTELEEICHFIHVVLFALKASLYWEHIPSKSNWADPISRLGSKDPWHRREGFTRFSSFFYYRLLKLPVHTGSPIFVVPWEVVHWDLSVSDPSLEEPGMDRPGIWLR